jgi:hypothetical protein
MPFARLDETLESLKRSEEERIRRGFKYAAYTAYLLRPNPDELTFGQFVEKLGIQSEKEIEMVTEAEIQEAKEVCEIADRLAKEGKYKILRGARSLSLVGMLKE